MADHPDRQTKWRPDSDRWWICHVGELRVRDPQGNRSEGKVDRTPNWLSYRVWRRNLRAKHHLWPDAGCTTNQLSVHLPGSSFSVPDDLRTLVVMSAIPLSLFGAVMGLVLTGNPFGFTSFMGCIALSGIVVRNSIILIDYINEKRRAGSTLEEAALEAGERRLRPIFLTTMAAAVGCVDRRSSEIGCREAVNALMGQLHRGNWFEDRDVGDKAKGDMVKTQEEHVHTAPESSHRSDEATDLAIEHPALDQEAIARLAARV